MKPLKQWKSKTMVGNIIVVGAQRPCVLLYSLGDLKAATSSNSRTYASEFKLGHNTMETT